MVLALAVQGAVYSAKEVASLAELVVDGTLQVSCCFDLTPECSRILR